MKNTNLSLTVAIPAFNEELTISKVISKALKSIKKITTNYELLIVNDGSTDGTSRIMSIFEKKDKRIKVIHHEKNLGFSGGIKSCFKNASKDFVLLAPADGQFDFHQLRDFVKAIDNKDLVLGFRVINHEPIDRKIQSWIFHNLCKTLYGIPIIEIPTISLWRNSLLKKLHISVSDRSNMVLPELIYQAYTKGYEFNQIPIIWYPRIGGVPKGRNNVILILSTLREMIGLFWKIRVKGNF